MLELAPGDRSPTSWPRCAGRGGQRAEESQGARDYYKSAYLQGHAWSGQISSYPPQPPLSAGAEASLTST